MGSIGVIFGRFCPITCEHEKLFDAMEADKHDQSYVFVFNRDRTDKLPIGIRINYIRYLHPFQVIDASSFKGIPGALKWLQENVCDAGEMNFYAGAGDIGLLSKSKQGGSADEVVRVVTNYRKKHPEFSEKWDFLYHAILRGEYSGSHVRVAAGLYDPNNPNDVSHFGKMLHSRTFAEDVPVIMKALR